MENKKNTKKLKAYLPLIISLTVLLLVVASVALFVINSPDGSLNGAVKKAIEKTEKNKEYAVQISSSATIILGEFEKEISTDGYIYSEGSADKTVVYVNTSSETPDDTQQDFDVTALMYTDGKKVYDNTTGSPKEIEMSVDEFYEIVDEYELYKYDDKDVVDIEYHDKETEEYKGGQTIVTLKKPNEKVLKAYASAISEITGENVSSDELDVKSAVAIYSIYDDLVVSQTCNFNVEYVCEDSQILEYLGTTQVSYYHDFDPEQIEEYISESDKEE